MTTPTVWADVDGAVFVLFDDNRGPYIRLDRDGTATEQFTLPFGVVQIARPTDAFAERPREAGAA